MYFVLFLFNFTCKVVRIKLEEDNGEQRTEKNKTTKIIRYTCIPIR